MTDELTLANERQLLQTLLERVSVRVAIEKEIESRHAAEIATESGQYQTVFQHLTDSYEAEQTHLDQTRESQLAESDRRCQSELAGVQTEYQRILSEAEDYYTKETESATKERDESVWLVSSLLDDDTEGSPLQRLLNAHSTFAAAEIELTTGMQSLEAGYDQVVTFLQRSHLLSEPIEPESSVEKGAVDAMKSACLAAINACDPLRQQILGRVLPRLFMGFVPIVLFALIAGLVFGLVWGLLNPELLSLKVKATDPDWLFIAAGIAVVFSVLPMFFIHLAAGRRTLPDFEQYAQNLINARHAYSNWERTSKTELNMLEAECSHLQDLRVKRRESAISAAETKLQNQLVEIERKNTSTLQYARNSYPARLNAIESRRVSEHEQFEQQYQAGLQDMIFRREADFRMLQSEYDKRTMDSRRRYQQAWLDLIHTWQADIDRLGKLSDSFCAAANALCPSWNQVARDDMPFPTASPPVLSLGRVDVDLDMVEGGLSLDQRLKSNRQRFDLPVLLPLHDQPSLILKATGKGRDAAVRTLQSTMLRFLTSLPPGKVRFTILDPVGLGANFSAFMHLADFDELLVTSRIWTEPSHIEKRLADLTEHMETVLQTYLRNEFPTIDDYNQFAGEVAEPYRVLVIANFPVNFTDVALRRLASIAEGGSRCGVFLLMSFDKSHELPRGFAAADLEKHATVLEWTEQGFHLSDPEIAQWPLTLEPPPPADVFGQIVRLAGQHSRDVRRVEVPFERVAPPEGRFWTSDSRTGIDVPIGRAGATKLQHLRLGKGTSQHVLVAGKTGSGKSTLLHALITNLALHYSPTEVEFYLIDFKKGVEFKVYAEQQLPHARVIAIESDREFGVSVLERLDTLLRDRGELFREASVQDIAGYRNARPDAVMPRTLLLVDEFQEFFIEDDAMSQQAALLLDRLIRQGRAFGVHILLGSQTLAGAYSLARSTLGQIAVRIALQCSDTDAHLILSEENTAARLLTRPGEAIYNDANGLIEGNHPFQIVWLGENDRESYLNLVRHEADGSGNRGKTTEAIRRLSQTPPLVFEGNIPADPTSNQNLQQILAQYRSVSCDSMGNRIAKADTTWKCWLGDSVSLGGPIEMSFGLREGGNTLIVGRDDQAALGIMAACAISLSVQSVDDANFPPTIQVLDGSLPNSDSAKTWRLLESMFVNHKSAEAAAATNHRTMIKTSSLRETADVINDVIAELHRRADEPGQPLFLFIFDLARFRDLRKAEDDFSYGGGGDKSTSPAQLFTEILRDGPGLGIFTFAWVDSYQSAQRWLSREQLNRFEQRVLFAMNVNDSSSLVDSPLAGRLGENRALLYRGDTGTLEKFRPFSPPPDKWLENLMSSTATSSVPANSPLRMPLPQAETPRVDSSDSPAQPFDSPGTEVSDELPCIDDLQVM